MTGELQALLSRLHEKDYKLTPQRKVILKAFVENKDEHLSAEDIYGIVKEQYPDIGLATVYRTLDLLAELGILLRMNFGDGRFRYEFSNADVHQHHHLICMECGRVQEFADDLLEDLEKRVGEENGFRVVDHQVKFYGYCSECDRKKA